MKIASHKRTRLGVVELLPVARKLTEHLEAEMRDADERLRGKAKRFSSRGDGARELAGGAAP